MPSLSGQVNRLAPALVPALRRVWAEAMFPGDSATTGRTRVTSWLLVVALPALLLYPCLGFHLLEPDEGRYAEIPREMLARGEWVVPILQGEPYLDKPPLLYWLVMLSYQVFGVHVWAARLVPALAVHCCILATYGFGTKIFGERRGRRAALLLAVMPALSSVGRLLTLDGLLTLWVALGLYSGYLAINRHRPRWALAVLTLACGLGVLTKGPIELVLVLVPLFIWSRLHRDRYEPLGWRQWLLLTLGVVAINAPWYIAVSIRQPEFARYFFWQHNLQRFFAPFDHPQPIWYYGPILLGCLFPASLWLASAGRGLCSARHADRRSPDVSFCLIAGGWCVAFFSASGCKLPTYILPAFPLLALALAILLERGNRLFTRGQWICGSIWLIALCGVQWFGLPKYSRERSPFRDSAVVRRCCQDPQVTVVCYPRNCDSLSFYLRRDDLHSTRSKEVNHLIEDCLSRPRTVVLFTHRHSMQAFSYAMPATLRLTPRADFHKPGRFGDVPWGLCDIGVVERVDAH